MTEQRNNSKNRISGERKYGYYSWKIKYKQLIQELTVMKRNAIVMVINSSLIL